jgi:thiol-disulfide isomerase/thioredoxin
MTGAVVAIVALLAATVFGMLWRRGTGALRPVTLAAGAGAEQVRATDAADGARGAPGATGAQSQSQPQALGPEFGPEFEQGLGERATLVQFSSAFCAPCRATRRLLDEVAAMVDGVRYIEIDAERRLDLVRRLGVLRTPTVLVLDGAGRIVRRGSGLPRKADVIAALGAAIPDPIKDPAADPAK